MSDMKMAGFKFLDNNHVLKNDWEDDLTKSVFDASVRGNTSRFVHKYINPN
jgi:predicted methyltransferase